jgi:uncharacterized protein (DUF433 family)
MLPTPHVIDIEWSQLRRFPMLEFDRITFDPNVMGGKTCIRGMRVTISLIMNLVANGMSSEEIIEAYPYLEQKDIRQALQYSVSSQDHLPISRGS